MIDILIRVMAIIALILVIKCVYDMLLYSIKDLHYHGKDREYFIYDIFSIAFALSAIAFSINILLNITRGLWRLMK